MRQQDAPGEELERVGGLLEAHAWVFARTMPHNPHWYTLRRTWNDDAVVSVVVSIRRHGYDEMYQGRVYRVMNVGGFKYWTMGAPLDETILINRKPVGQP